MFRPTQNDLKRCAAVVTFEDAVSHSIVQNLIRNAEFDQEDYLNEVKTALLEKGFRKDFVSNTLEHIKEKAEKEFILATVSGIINGHGGSNIKPTIFVEQLCAVLEDIDAKEKSVS